MCSPQNSCSNPSSKGSSRSPFSGSVPFDSQSPGFTSSSRGSTPAKRIHDCFQACENLASRLSSEKNSPGSRSAPSLGRSFPSRAQSAPLPPRPGRPGSQRENVSAPQPAIHNFNVTPDSTTSSFANVILNFNYSMDGEWGQAKRFPGQQFGVSADSMDITPSFKLSPDLHSTPIHPIDPNQTPSSLFDSVPESVFQISAPIKHLFDSRLLGNNSSSQQVANSMISVLSNVAEQEKSQTLKGLKKFQKKRRQMLCCIL